MNNRSWAWPVVWLLLGLGFLGAGWGCSKRAVSSSGDRTTVASAPIPSQPPPVETVRPEPIVTMPEEKPAPIEAAREPLTSPEPTVSSEPPPALPSEPAPPEAAPPALPPVAVVPAPPSEPAPPEAAPPALPPVAVVPAPSPAPSAVKEDAGLMDIHFDYDRYAIRTDAEPVLQANAAWITNHTGKSIVIEGHCDERGTLAYNLVLGENRARAAKRYLEDLGVPASRLKIISYGEVRPVCKDYEEGCWQRNRRAHFLPAP